MIFDMKLLPGGRWLLVLNTYGVGLWDLDETNIGKMHMVAPLDAAYLLPGPESSRRFFNIYKFSKFEFDATCMPYSFQTVLIDP